MAVSDSVGKTVVVDAETGMKVGLDVAMTSFNGRRELREMLERFVRGEDRSLAYVNRIEHVLSEAFRGTPLYEELIQDVATY